MNAFSLIPSLVIIVYLAIVIGVFILVYNWVNKFISLKQEQNEILRDIARKLEK